jgi:dihydrofolate reductase
MNAAKIRISSIAAMARNRVIGVANGLAWHIPEDFKYFKKTTLGHPVVMGRKSYESLGKPLPGRPNIVISSSFQEPVNGDGPFFVRTIDEALAFAQQKAEELNVEQIFIIGGGQIYKETLPITERLYITIIDREYEGDTYFPDFDWNDWNVVSEDKRDGDPAFTFYVLERK